MALMEIAAEEDVELNSQNQLAIKKIQMLPLLTDFLSKKHLQQEFLDRGVLSLFKIWLKPLPNGSRGGSWTHTFPIEISSGGRREQLKRSGLGKVIMFLSKSDNANRQLAKDLVENWSRTIFNKSSRHADLRNAEEKLVMPMKKVKESAMQVREADLDLELRPKQPCLSAASDSRSGVWEPEAAACVYGVIPRTKFKADAEVERARVRYIAHRDYKSYKRIEKGIRRMKNSNKKTVYEPFTACKAPIC
ncbi:hypothetical protein V6N11_054180 [Hibiscus sabdariffa]|uniref:TFIIS N-terminal domain-containing protein n=1 Tax=Hibiscus sabdariffa TaxID=183260 RepID=A0ABR2S345_9ROSI